MISSDVIEGHPLNLRVHLQKLFDVGVPYFSCPFPFPAFSTLPPEGLCHIFQFYIFTSLCCIFMFLHFHVVHVVRRV